VKRAPKARKIFSRNWNITITLPWRNSF